MVVALRVLTGVKRWSLLQKQNGIVQDIEFIPTNVGTSIRTVCLEATVPRPLDGTVPASSSTQQHEYSSQVKYVVCVLNHVPGFLDTNMA